MAPISPAKTGSAAQQSNLYSTAKFMKEFHNINSPLYILVSVGEGDAKSMKCVFRCFLKVATEMSEQTDRGRLLQRDGAQE